MCAPTRNTVWYALLASRAAGADITMLFGMRTSARSDDGPAAEASGVASVATTTNPNLRGSRVGKWLVRRTPFYYGYVILLVGTIGKAFSAPGQTPVVGSVMDFIIDDLGMPASTVTTLYSSATLASSFTLFILGWLLDRFGLRITGIATSIILAATLVIGAHFVHGPVLLIVFFYFIRYFGQVSPSRMRPFHACVPSIP